MTDQPILEGELVAAQERSLSLGAANLALMPEREFQAALSALKTAQTRVRQIKRELMTEGVHFGVIPGAEKPSLLKAGAEVLLAPYGLRPRFRRLPLVPDPDGPPIRESVLCRIYDPQNRLLGEGLGTCNSWEKKYRYRTADRVCPACGKPLRVSRNPGEGWYCWRKKGGCGATFKPADPAVANQRVGQIDNPDPWDLANTILKMAAKRAFVDAVLRVTASSDLFTQDLEDLYPGEAQEAEVIEEPAGTIPGPPPGQAKAAFPGAASSAPAGPGPTSAPRAEGPPPEPGRPVEYAPPSEVQALWMMARACAPHLTDNDRKRKLHELLSRRGIGSSTEIPRAQYHDIIKEVRQWQPKP